MPTDQTCFRLLYHNAQGTSLLERDEASQRRALPAGGRDEITPL